MRRGGVSDANALLYHAALYVQPTRHNYIGVGTRFPFVGSMNAAVSSSCNQCGITGSETQTDQKLDPILHHH